MLARPLVLRLAGAVEPPPRTFPVTAGLQLPQARRAAANMSAPTSLPKMAALVARKFPKDGAGILSSIVQSEGFAILDETITELAPGATVDFFHLRLS